MTFTQTYTKPTWEAKSWPWTQLGPSLFRLLPPLVCGIFRCSVFQMLCFKQSLLPAHAVFKKTQSILLRDYSRRFWTQLWTNMNQYESIYEPIYEPIWTNMGQYEPIGTNMNDLWAIYERCFLCLLLHLLFLLLCLLLHLLFLLLCLLLKLHLFRFLIKREPTENAERASLYI